jgi:glyoxylase-like metal-dependent hydrolase (beta-lactamase superfamily II)
MLGIALVASFPLGCKLSSHPATSASLGNATTMTEMESTIDSPGAIQFETIVAADWTVKLSGLVNLDAPKAKEANLQERDEAIQVYFYALRHPSRGLFLVDTGAEKNLRDAPENAAVKGTVASVMHLEKMTVRTDTATWLSKQPLPPAGIFLTHLHVDHVMGLPDIPKTTPIFAGPGEISDKAFVNVFLKETINREFDAFSALQEWTFPTPETGLPVLDVFGDKMLYAIFAPGHTDGSTAYLARTTEGPVLMVGDVCHTVWGWENGVEPGSFTKNHEQNAQSLEALRQLSSRHPKMKVKLGHQAFPLP